MNKPPQQDITLVLIPGLLCDRAVWEPLLDALGGTYPVVIAELDQQDSLTVMAQDTLERCHGDLVVIGHSMGARVALELVRLAPERVQKLALLDTGIHPYKPGEEKRRNELVQLGYEQGMRALADQWLPPMVHDAHHSNQGLMDRLYQMVESKTPEIHEQQIRALLNRPDAHATVATIQCPTLILVGAEDKWSPVVQHQTIHELVANSELVVIENAGHFAPVEQPEAVNQAIKTWLEAGQ